MIPSELKIVKTETAIGDKIQKYSLIKNLNPKKKLKGVKLTVSFSYAL